MDIHISLSRARTLASEKRLAHLFTAISHIPHEVTLHGLKVSLLEFSYPFDPFKLLDGHGKLFATFDARSCFGQ